MGRWRYCILFLFCLFPTALSAGGEWVLSRDKEGIRVYTRKFGDYNYREYKGITTISGKVEDLADLLMDFEHYHEWSYNCVEGSPRLLKKDEERGEYYVYMEVKAPIVANRDVITVYKIHPRGEDGSLYVEFWGDKDFIPKKNGLVRIPELTGYWKAVPVEMGQFRVIHQAFSHPGGQPPAALVNSSAVAAPFSILKKIRNLIEK